MYYWHPEVLYGVPITNQICECGKGKLAFKEMSKFRRVEEVHETSFVTAAIYVCRGVAGCKKSISTLDETIERYLPEDVMLACPVRAFKKSCWSSDMIALMCDLIVQTTNISSFVNAVSRARTSSYLKASTIFQSHKKYFNRHGSGFSSETPDESIGSFFTHCKDGWMERFFGSVY